jgi:hypothetical protein
MKVMRKFAPVVALVGGLVLAGAGSAHADANAEGVAIGSPGVLSGNVIQIPVDLNLNVCGNSVNVIGLLNPAIGNTCTITGGKGDSDKGSGSWHHVNWHHNVSQDNASQDSGSHDQVVKQREHDGDDCSKEREHHDDDECDCDD